MVRLVFDTFDIDEDSIEFYHDVEISKGGMEAATISDMVKLFKSFLSGIGFPEELIERTLGDDEDEYVVAASDNVGNVTRAFGEPIEEEPLEEPVEEEASV